MSAVSVKKQSKTPGALKAPWKPGQSGNPNGRPKGTSPRQIVSAKLSEIIKDRLFTASDEDKTKTELDLIVSALATKAKEGDGNCAKVLFDRGFGQPVATNELILTKRAGESTLAKWLEENG